MVLVDGSNLWYRAFSVNPGLDVPGGPILIFSSMLRKIAREFGKRNIVVCWDAGHGGRAEIDPNYKSNREHIKGVWDYLVYAANLVELLGLKIAFLEGFEADDVIGSLALKSSMPVKILSYDKDFYQLVTGTITVFRPARKIHGVQKPDEIIDTASVIKEFGCLPDKLPLLKSFLGDASDNIPKLPLRLTAAFKKQLLMVINKFSNIEEIYLNLDTFDTKYLTILESFKERAMLSFKMLKIKTDLEPKVIESNFDEAGLQTLCDDLKIKSLKLEEWKQLDLDLNDESSSQSSLF